MTDLHSRFMQRALTLAQKGKGKVHPNPLVGAVVVKNGKIIGEGFHQTYGGPHAEILALQNAGSQTKGATLYINLEPCSHWGKTPPCAPAIIKAGIKHVFIALKDPNPDVNGRGMALLKKSGIKVALGLEKEAAEFQNRAFLTWMRAKRPYTILKLAVSLDGKIASRTGDSKWISSNASRRLVHKMRAESDAVLVGANTALKDNPHLTSHSAGRDPIRIVLDPHFRTKAGLRMFNHSGGPTWVVTSAKASHAKDKTFQKKGVKILRETLKSGSFKMKTILNKFSKDNVSQLFVEGGGETSWNLLSQKLVDEVLLFVAPIIVGGRDAKTAVEGLGISSIKKAFKLQHMDIGRVGPDLLIRGFLN